MHRLLKRQIKRTLGNEKVLDSLDPKIESLLKMVSDVYEDFDEQRRINEHIISVNSEELKISNMQLEQLLKERSKSLENKTNENKEIVNILHQYKEAIDKSLIVSRTDKNGFITYANDNFCKISEYSREELIGKPHNIVRDPKNSSEIYKDMWNTITNKKIWQGTISNITKNGAIYYVKSTIIPLVNSKGDTQEYVALRDDITPQVLYQKKLKHQTQRINTIFNSQENITIIIKPNIGIIDVNKKFFDTFGFKNLVEFKNSLSCISNLFNEPKILNDRNWYKKFLDKNSEIKSLTRIDEKGKEQIFSISAKKIELDEREHYLVTLIDITELENARRKAEIAKEAKSIFLANMSHEIRTPLNAIIGFSDLLKNKKLTKEENEYSSIIYKSAESLLDIIDDVLDISKMESGKIFIEKEAFPINIFMDNIVELFSVKAKEKNIRFIYDVDPNIPYSVVNDSTRIRQVLSNLLSNAIKFTDEYGHIVLKMLLSKKYDEFVEIKFSIKDDGIGISKEQQEIIFLPFSQADSGINRKFGGTGLGLAITKDIITMLGSKITIESEINKGSTFSFILKFKVDKLVDEKDHHYNAATFAVSNISNDDEHLRINIINYLTKIGRVFDFDENSIYKNIDILFCFNSQNVANTIQNFRRLNIDSKIVYVGDRKEIKDLDITSYINDFIDLPIYGSKIFNIISDNNNIDDIEQEITSNKKVIENYDLDILVAEDNLNNQKLIEILLSQLNINCTIANNGVEAIELYENNKYDLVLMDINMPLLDGVSATQEILKKQKEENLYKIPIIALTANSLEGDREKYIYAGMDDYISKPIIFDKLKEMIKKYSVFSQKDKTISKKSVSEEVDLKQNISFEIELKKEEIMESLGVSEQIVDLLIKNFLKTIDDDLLKLQEAYELNDFDAIEKQAHYIKGTCLNLSIKEAVEVLENIEQTAKEKIFDIDELAKVKSILNSLKNSL